MRLPASLAAALLVLASAPAGRAAEPSQMHMDPSGMAADLLTMGPGDRLFEVFGHAALCVGRGESGDCFNYGVTDFQQGGLVLGFLRGRMPFWVERIPYRRMLYYYQHRDRTVWRQRLDLSPSQLDRMLARLRHDASPEHRRYPYDHFRANCTSKIRDVIDEALGGALRAATDVPSEPSLRMLVRTGFAGRPALEWLGDAMMGRTLDRLPTRWEAMFLPHYLRDEVAKLRVGGRAVAPWPAQPVHVRKAPDPIAGSPYSGLVVGAVVAALYLGLTLAAGLRGGLAERATIALGGLVLGLLGAATWFIALVSTSPDLRQNEALVVLWPVDLWLAAGAWLATARRPRLGRLVGRYLAVRAAVAALALLLALPNLLRQPFEAHAATVLAFAGGLLLARRLRAARAPAEPSALGAAPDAA